ncbi:hypothetical protein HUT19_21355 [Streptomyces sp. NA02950]|uniref:hypothetical protein n=1 Tax=Streptomyces sp. NA02950 TaxID=2742137 RepID=UPI001592A0D2|nr:hypothetical protein [Streptomyces sp. NA02950]QKV93989.1 hypothetical protein HUT19_21355 [Streptomyces sp. NA02950]
MSEISSAIDALLQRRLRQLPEVERESARWQALGERLDELDLAVADLRGHTTMDGELAAALTMPQLPQIRLAVAEAADAFRVIGSRFTRPTVNIGVSGAARMGKSTLLQSISGLDNNQIPTGHGIPVTAVRSRIFHSPAVRRAELEMHGPESFLAEVVAPLHAALELTTAPRTIAEFGQWPYPDSVADPRGRLLLTRLRDLRNALESYEPLLTGGVRTVPLEEIRPYVAYPTHEEITEAAGRVPRVYAAVREARIECAFPHPDVARIGIVDLPGLGEVIADADQRHVAGLQNEVDAVLLVKRSSETSSFFDETDTVGLTLLERIRGQVRSTGEFIYLVHNLDPDKPHLAENLRGDLLRNVNSGQADRFFTVLETDVRDPERVGREVLTPLLKRLAEGLPVMDAEVMSGTRRRASAARDRIRLQLTDVRRVLDRVARQAGVPEEVNDAKAAQLRSGIAKRLRLLVAHLAAETQSAMADPGFTDAVADAYQGVLDWIGDGFGRGVRNWQEEALTCMVTEGHAAAFAGPEFSRIRVELSRRFAALDDFFTGRLVEAWERTAAVFVIECGALFAEAETDGLEGDGVQGGNVEGDGAGDDEPAGPTGRELLERLAELFARSSQPCPDLAAAVTDLLDVRLEYRTLLYPRVRPDLAPLNLQVTHPDTGEQMQQVAVPLTEEGAEELYGIFNGLAEQAAFRIQKSLLQESAVPAAVIHALVEQFEDTLIRSGTSVQEFRRFVRSYRNDLWPEEFRGIDEANSRYARVVRVAEEISDLIEEDSQ